jgi:SSS family solute:Na+ symporter
MHFLAPLDYVIILGYLGLSLVVGLIMSRKASASIDNYFLAGRSLPWYLLGIAGMANWFDLTGTMVITSFLYMLGPRGLYIEFRGGACLALAFMLAFTGKWHRRSGCMTGAEWMTYRFGQSKAAESVRLLTAVLAILASVMMLAYLIRGASLFLGVFFPYPPAETTLVLIIVSTLYTMGAGFYGVVLTDLVQGVIIVFSCVIIGVMAWHMVPDSAHLAATAAEVTGNMRWTDSKLSEHTSMPNGYQQYEPLLMMAMFYLFRNVLGGLGSGNETRYFAARNDRECGLQSLLQGLMVMFRWPLMIGFAVMGIYLVKSLYPDAAIIHEAAALIHRYHPQVNEASWHDLTNGIINVPGRESGDLIAALRTKLGENWRGKLPLIGFHGNINPEEILPAVLLNDIPTGLRGMLVVAMFAAMMSCKNGVVNSASAFFVKDIYQNFLRPAAANTELILMSYLSTLAVVIVGFYFGMIATSINDLWGWIVMSLIAGGLAPGLLRLYWWRCNAGGMFGGLLLGAVGAFTQRILDPAMPEWMQFVTMTSLSFAGTIGGSLLTRPTPLDILRHFYRTTRPFGWWRPLRGEFSGEQRQAVDQENRNDILTVPFALLWQVTLFLLPMQLVIKSYTSFLFTLPLFLVGLAGMYIFWWRQLWTESKVASLPTTSKECGS